MKKNVKRIAVILMAVLMLVTAMPLNGIVGTDLFASKASAAELAPTGQCGENAFWTFDSETGLLTISGTGTIDRNNGSTVFYNQRGIKSIVIEKGITSLGDSLFALCTYLKTVSIPDTVTSIGRDVFRGCALSSVLLPDSVCELGSSVFKDCTNLSEVRLSDNLTCITSAMFANCVNLKNIDIPENVRSIHSEAFSNTGFESIYIHDSITSIHSRAFINCSNLKEIIVDKNNQYYCNDENGVLYDKDKTSLITYPAACICEDYSIPEGVSSIEVYAIYNCEIIKNITIPKSVSEIGYGAFDDCDRLENIIVSPDNSVYCSLDGVLCKKGKVIEIIKFPENKKELSYVVPDNVKIDSNSFRNCQNLEKITIPETINSITYGCFENCKNLKIVELNDKITNIGTYSFRNCVSLTEFEVPELVSEIASQTFEGCENLEVIKIPSNVKKIGIDAFRSCVKLSDVYFSGTEFQWNNISISSGNTSLLNATVHYGKDIITDSCGENLTYVFDESIGLLTISGTGNMNDYNGNNTLFYNGSMIKSVLIENGVTSIGNYAFDNYTNLMNVIIPNSVTSIGDYAFWGCTGLTNINIADNVASIGNNAFRGCTGLTSITVSSKNTIYDSRDDCNAIIETSTNRLIVGCQNTTIPDGVKEISDYAFQNQCDLKNISLPESVIDISSTAFRGCTGLTSITVSPDNNVYDSRDNCNAIIKTSSNTLLFGCRNTSIPNNIKEIGDYAFYNQFGLTNLTLPDSLTKIGVCAFSGCTGITKIVIPKKVSSIGDLAFYGCTGLTDLTISDGVTCSLYEVFPGCTGLTSVIIPDSITWLGYYAFKDCTGLKSVKLSNNLKTISGRAFGGCSSLTSITIPDSVTSIESEVFDGCKNLKTVNIPDGVTNIGRRTFRNCAALTEITLPSNLQSIGDELFRSCTNLKNIIIPNGVINIGSQAFQYCKCLSSVTIPYTVTKVGDDAFNSCTGLKDTYYSGTKAQWNSIVVGKNNDGLYNATIHYNYGKTSGECGENINWVFDETDGSLLISGTGAMNSFENIEDYGWSNVKDHINYVEVSDGIVSIGANAFAGCSNINEVFLGDSVTDIGTDAFADCTSLALVTVTSGGFNAENAFLNNDSKLTFIIPENNYDAQNFANDNGIPVITVSYADSTIDFKGGTTVYNSLQYNYLTNFINKYSSAEYLHFDTLEFDGVRPDIIIIDDCENIDLTARNFTLKDLFVSVNVVKDGVDRRITFAQMFELLENGDYDAFKLKIHSEEQQTEQTFFEKVIQFFDELTTSALRVITKAINFVVGLFKKK